MVLDEKAVTALTKASQCLYELQHYKKIMLGLALNSGEDREYILKAVAKGTDMCTEGTEFNTIVQSHPDLSPVYDAVCSNSEISKQIHNCLIGNVEIPFF